MIVKPLLFGVLTAWLAGAVLAQTPFPGPQPGDVEFGAPFPLPQLSFPQTGRRIVEGDSNGLTVAWDGRLIMYFDRSPALWANRPNDTIWWGWVFATFEPPTTTTLTGLPDFSTCIGTPYPRFADVTDTAAPTPGHLNANTYPDWSAFPNAYPYIDATPSGVGSMGELGLHHSEVLSNNMYPVPEAQLPSGAHGANPFPSDVNGAPSALGAYRTYHMYVTFQDLPRFYQSCGGSTPEWRGYYGHSSTGCQGLTTYEQGASKTYPNGEHGAAWGMTQLRNGRCKLRITVRPDLKQVTAVEVLEKWKPFQVIGDGTWTNQVGLTVGLSVPANNRMYANGFEPTLTLDGHLMVIKWFEELVDGCGTSRVIYLYNQNAFADDGWEGPWEFQKLYLDNAHVLDGLSIAERYPISRHPIKDYDGTILGDTNGDGVLTPAEADAADFEGGYTWLSPDGRYLIYSVMSSGVGSGHPETTLAQDGGGISNRGQTSIVGSVTGWQMWRIDHSAENPNRHMFTGWDQDSRTTHQRVASFGFSPGFWDMLRGGAGLPMHSGEGPRLALVNSQRLLYYELDLSPYQERDYGFYLPMTEMLRLAPSMTCEPLRDVDISRTPDLSGHGHVGVVQGGQLPCEYFELPRWMNPVGSQFPGFFSGATSVAQIDPRWSAADTITDSTGKFWALLADWTDGKPNPPVTTPNVPVFPATTPFAGRGNKHDMDSDTCWGRVGQAMFFRDSTYVSVSNASLPPELNPGTNVPGASDALTASLWVWPLQNRTTKTDLFSHSVRIALSRTGEIKASALNGGTAYTITTPTNSAPVNAWTHVALTWVDVAAAGKSELRVYLNGVEATGSPLVLPFDRLDTLSTDIHVGCLANCATTAANAVLLLDEVALKNSAMSLEAIEDLALLNQTPPAFEYPSSFPPAPSPFKNDVDARVPLGSPYTLGVARLGADLFHDVQLSGTKDMSCATCHISKFAFTDGETTGVGQGGLMLLRNTPTLVNQRFNIRQRWDARAENLEAQAGDPIVDANEMNNNWSAVKNYLASDPDYSSRFQLYMGTSTPSEDDVRRAIATFERTLTAGDSPADLYEATGGGLTAAEIHGRNLFFGAARCSGCHNGPNFADGRVWSTGSVTSNGSDDGAFRADAGPYTAGRPRFFGAFKTPTLRQLGATGPYFHDGSASSLIEVLKFYNDGGVRVDGAGYSLLDPIHDVTAEETNRKLGLSPSDLLDLEAYLLALQSNSPDNGPAGFNSQPKATIQPLVYSSAGGVTVLKASIDITDTDGQSDIDTSMDWTLDFTVGGVHYHWSNAVISSIANGYRATVVISPAPSNPGPRGKGADMHGFWSN